MATSNVLDMPKRPNGIKKRATRDMQKEFITVDGYSLSQNRTLSATPDDLELEVNLRTYDLMERDTTIWKGKNILVTNVLADDLQMAEGATEDSVGPDEFEIYGQVMAFCERVIHGIQSPLRITLAQLLGNSIKHGHGIAEIEWEYRKDGPESNYTPKKVQKGRFRSMMENWGIMAATPDTVEDPTKKRPSLKGQQTRLMPKVIKVKPRGAALFVVDDYMNILGLVPRNRDYRNFKVNQIIDREKFMILTLNQQDEDPRGRSFYRSAFNWYNLKTQVPVEMLRFILEESTPKAVGILPEDSPPYEFDRDANDNILYDEFLDEDGNTTRTPRMRTAAESMGDQIKGFRAGSGAVIPFGAKLEPFKKSGTSDADLFGKILKVIDNQMENAILLQTLAQSEGEHQARSASQQVAELLHNLVFWIRWLLAVTIVRDLLETSVRYNLGEWALKYMPIVSLGDFVRRDWAKDLEVVAKAYFQGFIDDSQRAEIMAWLNLPKPGLSRQELMQDALAEADVNGEPVKPNTSRPDKQPANKNRNTGNGTEKKKNEQSTSAQSVTGFSSLNRLGNHRERPTGFKRHLRASNRTW